jgi:hypothetical protein
LLLLLKGHLCHDSVQDSVAGAGGILDCKPAKQQQRGDAQHSAMLHSSEAAHASLLGGVLVGATTGSHIMQVL